MRIADKFIPGTEMPNTSTYEESKIHTVEAFEPFKEFSFTLLVLLSNVPAVKDNALIFILSITLKIRVLSIFMVEI